jgi:S-phase kinase-associated protein 1
MVLLETSDKKQYNVDKSIAYQSRLIKNMLQDLEIKEDLIPLPNITSHILDLIIKYAIARKDDPITNNDDSEHIESEQDLDFLNLSNQELIELTLAANYLDIPALLHLGRNKLNIGCRKLASILESKTIEQVYEEFSVPQDIRYTPQERELIEQELKWAQGSSTD